MDDLIKKRSVVGADLVKAVTSLMPGDSIEHVLDAVRAIMLKRVMDDIKVIQFPTVIHLVAHLKTIGLTAPDADLVLRGLETDPDGPIELRRAIASLSSSALLDPVFDFVSINDTDQPGCFCFSKSPKQSKR